MEVILIKTIKGLGNIADLVKVKDGFARNYLIPTGQALRATKENKNSVLEKKSSYLKEYNNLKNEASKIASSYKDKEVVFIANAAHDGRLFGSVTSKDVARKISTEKISISSKQILLKKPVKNLGIHEVIVELHPEVDCKIILNVARSQDEAKSAFKEHKQQEKPNN